MVDHFTVPGGTTRFLSACFAGTDWSLGPLYEPQDAYKHPDLAARVGRALAGLVAINVYAPNPTAFNGEILLRKNLTDVFGLGSGVLLHRKREPKADGVFLTDKGDAFTFSGGGCGMVVVSLRTDLIAAHAGRESLLDRQEVVTDGKEKSRERDLADNILVNLGACGGDMHSVHSWPLYFIRPEEFAHRPDDPKHHAYNCAAARYLSAKYGAHAGQVEDGTLYMDLPRIFQKQLVERGVPEENIHLEHAYLPRGLPHTRNGGGRYLAAAVRHT